MSYEKLGFVKGQVLKAEHLNHMEEGIANAGGGAGIEYYTGEVTVDGRNIVLADLTYDKLYNHCYQIEIAVRLHSDTNYPTYADYSWYTQVIGESADSSAISRTPIKNKAFPTACLWSDWSEGNIKIEFISGDNCVPVNNLQLLYARLYPKV